MTYDPTDDLHAIWLKPSERDEQTLVGASNISNLCTRCLAEDIHGEPQPDSFYDAGAKIGTAVHLYLEHEAPKEWHKEIRMEIGTIEGYGTVTSTADVYRDDRKAVWDYKTTTRAKMKTIDRVLTEPESEYDSTTVAEMRHKVNGYKVQANLYGWGMAKAGYEVEELVLAFIPRDAQNVRRDMKAYLLPYQPALAEKAWNRAKKIYYALQKGKGVDTFVSNPLCWTCNNNR